jgi:hypothetical protein
MQTDTRLGTFGEVVACFSGEVQQIARQLRALIESVHPEALEVPRPGERTAGYGIGPKKLSETYAYIGPQRGYVNLGFYHGVAVPDPDGLLEGAGKALRHVKVRSIEDAGRPALRRLVEAALCERQAALNRGRSSPKPGLKRTPARKVGSRGSARRRRGR